MNLKTKTIIILCIILSMLFPITLPVLAYSQADVPVIDVGGTEHILSIAPYKNDLGVIVSAEDITKSFGMDYSYNDEDKTFTIYSPKHGEVVLSNNATSFKSEENTFECLPYYFVKNNMPMIEVGFFCEMFNSSYDYVENANIIAIYKDIPKYYDVPEE